MPNAIPPAMSDEAVARATGKTWKQWFAALDKAGAQTMSHKEIVAVLAAKHAVAPWWQQMVTVTYEKARGLRELHQTPAGYQVSAGRTLPVALDALWKRWADGRARARWLPVKFVKTASTPNKSFRATLADGSKIDVYFWPKGEGKAALSLSHTKLGDKKAVAAAKALWKTHLDALKDSLV